MVVQPCDLVIVRRAVEHFSDLLQEALPVQLGGGGKRILTKQNVLTFKSCVEAAKA